MKEFFLFWNFSTIIILVFFIIYAARKKGAVAKNIVLVCSALSLCLLFYSLRFFSTNITAVTIFCGIYYTIDLWILFEIFKFAITLTEISGHRGNKILLFNKYLFIVLVSIDAISFIVNIFLRHEFSITPIFSADQNLLYWKIKTYPPFYYHIALNAIMVLQNFIAFFVRSFRMPHFYRKKYFILGVMFLVIAVTNEVAQRRIAGYDISLCLYVFIASYAFYIAFFGMSNALLNSMLSLVSENIIYGVACFDEKEKCFYINRNASVVFGYGKVGYITVEGYKNKLKQLYSPNMPDFIKLSQDFAINGVLHKYECEYKIIRDKKNRPIVSYLKLEDTTENQKRLEQEKFRMEHDSLTGLYNRKAFFEHATEILHANPDEEFYLVATNIMDFKILNNLFGESMGNEILKLQAQTINSLTLVNEIGGRISGDKFAILLKKSNFDTDIFLRNNAILQQAVQKYNFKIQNYIGVYEISDNFENVKTMFDKAMLTIQKIRGNLEKSIAFYDMPLMEKMLREKNIVSEFDAALANGEFSMYLHPQVDAASLCVMGAEALVRWIAPGKGIVPPLEFIPILERSGLIHKLDQYIWELAVKKLAEWKSIGSEMYISINISPKDFYYCDVCSYLIGLVEKYGIEPQKINVEITETVLMQNVAADNDILKRLRESGFTIEMDDFGSGYSSLNTLKNFEMNILKIDMEFLRDWNLNNKSRDIISAIVKMSKSLGMTVISEGVETKDQADFLREIGCDIFQGFYFSKPMPVAEFEERYLNGGETK